MIILVDMDGVLADFEAAFLAQWREEMPGEFFLPVAERTSFYVRDDYPEHLHEKVHEIHGREGFFRNLPEIEGGVQAMHAMREAGHEVFICTSPLTSNQWCASEKMAWVGEHLGGEWLKRTIITSDKTLVRGDVLIDDRPSVDGVMTPMWEHVVFAAAYNTDVPQRRMESWSEWESILVPDDSTSRLWEPPRL